MISPLAPLSRLAHTSSTLCAFVLTCACAVTLACTFAGCDASGIVSGQPDASVPPPPLLPVSSPAGFPPYSLPELAPADNEPTEARAQLGKRLFFEPRLSRTGEVSCATCHRQENGFADPRPVSIGVDQRSGTRNAPALVNLAWGSSFFWDGRARTLEEQAGQPISHPDEMDLPLPEAVNRLNSDPVYTDAFQSAYGGPLTEALLRKALATFIRTMVSGGSPYDRHLRGDDGAFGEAERRGEEIFTTAKGGCFHCHPSGMLTNEGFFNNGTFRDGGDLGRQSLTGRPGDAGKFKVPGLRNVAASAPYMHDGSLQTLEAVVDHYDRGGLGHLTTDPQISPLLLSAADKTDLLAFLNALTDASFLSDRKFQH